MPEAVKRIVVLLTITAAATSLIAIASIINLFT